MCVALNDCTAVSLKVAPNSSCVQALTLGQITKVMLRRPEPLRTDSMSVMGSYGVVCIRCKKEDSSSSLYFAINHACHGVEMEHLLHMLSIGTTIRRSVDESDIEGRQRSKLMLRLSRRDK